MADPLARPHPAARRRALATCLWLVAAVLLGGIDLPATGYAAFQFAPFGLVAGLLGLVYVFALVTTGVVAIGSGWLKPFLLVYWVAATATAFRLLLPPAGLVQAGLALLAAIGAGALISRRDREGAALWLGIVAVSLAVLRFALVPFFASRSELPNMGPLRFGDSADALRDVFVAYAPQRPVVQALHFGALACYAAALWVQWTPPPEPPAAQVADLPSEPGSGA